MTWYKKALQKPSGLRPSRSGTPWSEAAYVEAGYGRLNLRLPERVLERLSEIAEARGISRAAAIEQLVLAAK